MKEGSPCSPALMAAKDDLGRVSPLNCLRKKREVGLFYFLWLGEHGTNTVYDNTQILSRDPGAPISKKRWEEAGGCGHYGAMHWWGEPLFHYYTAKDAWVIRRHIRMFIDAGIDFLMVDATNSSYYPEASQVLFSVLDEFYKDGWNVPKVGYYAFTRTASTLQRLYTDFYLQYPQYEHLWYKRAGKPFVVGDMADKEISPEVRAAFSMQDAYMSPEPHRHYKPDGSFTFQLDPHLNMFPWIDFSPRPTVMRNPDETPRMMTISVAEICETANSTYPYLWNTGDHTRSWDGTQNRNWLPGEEDAWKYGYNIGRQMEDVLLADPPTVFICGWNEWVAGNWASDRCWEKGNVLSRYTDDPGDMCMFVDQFDINNSRDIEPMRGGYGDLYFMQMVNFIRRYKGTFDPPSAGPRQTIDIGGSWDQWSQVSAVYRHPVCGNEPRSTALYENWKNDDPAARLFPRSDIAIRESRVCQDDENYYFFLRLTGPVPQGQNRMSLLLNPSPDASSSWHGYTFALRRIDSAREDAAALEVWRDGRWQAAASVPMRVEGRQMMLSVPKALLYPQGNPPEYLQFKWADMWREDRGADTFYTDGECAPYGRFNYLYPTQPEDP